ncbi:MAG: type II toxin-antitoxin system RelE/ParE family toxin [Treponema sp.]|nr:type II toxin-antitoxin system RelE/ParE family toxin [Treponema sp.]
MYKVTYLPLALNDLIGIVRYIANELEAPRAAENFVTKIDKEIQKIAENPFRCHLYSPLEKLKYEYRVLNIDSYSLFYIVNKDKVEIHRVLYSQMNIPPKLK